MALPWTLRADNDAQSMVMPEERLSWPRTIGFGMQHVVAMFGATFIVPVITGFPPSTTLLFSGIGTLLFLVITGNRLPSYLGSSFAFIVPIQVAVASESIGVALAGMIVVGGLLALTGIAVHFAGTGFINAAMPPVVAGTIVALIGFNLAPAARDNFATSPVLALITLGAILVVAVVGRGMVARLSILIGVVFGYVVAAFMGEVDWSKVGDAAWFGLPPLHAPVFTMDALPMYIMFLPVVLPLIAENVGHVKGVGQMLRRDLDPLAGRALFADGVATMLAGTGGGSPTTTYGENIGVMSATRVASTAAYWIAGCTAIVLALSPKVGAVIEAVPAGVLGGVTTALYGLIGIIGVRIWVENRVDFSVPKNQFTAGIGLVVAIAPFIIETRWFGNVVEFEGIILGTVAALVVFHLMQGLERLTGKRTRREDKIT